MICTFLSALVLKNGDVLTHPSLDSHSDLIVYFKLPDDHAHHQHFAKVELTPGPDWLDISTWIFRLDQATKPGWWKDIQGQAEQTLRDRAATMVLKTGHVPLLCDGVWILGGDVVVDRIVGDARIVRVQDNARVSDVWGGRFSDVRGGTFSTVEGGTFSDVGGGTFSNVAGGTFSGVGGGTRILLHREYGHYAQLDDSAKARIVKIIEESVHS